MTKKFRADAKHNQREKKRSSRKKKRGNNGGIILKKTKNKKKRGPKCWFENLLCKSKIKKDILGG